MAAVMIGVDPHKSSHTAVAISPAEVPLGELRVRASGAQALRLLEWAAAWPHRTWAIEGARGLGHLLAQQLLAAGELVLDVQPRLGARVRLLASGDTNKNDPNDARSVAVAALRSRVRREVIPDDHAEVLKMWAKRHRDLGRTRTQVVCRLHAALCELVPGGVSREIYAAHAAHLLESVTPSTAVQQARCELAAEFLDDLRRVDAQLLGAKKKLTMAVRASGSSLTSIFGVGPVVTATVIGAVRDVSRFPSRDHFAACNGTAPIEVSSGPRKIYRLSRRGNRRLNHAIHMAAVTQIRYPHSDGRACYERKLAEGKTPKEALRALKRRVSDAIYARLQADARHTAGTPQQAREGTRGTTPSPARPAHTPAPALRLSHSRTRHHLTTRPSTAAADDLPHLPQDLCKALTQRGIDMHASFRLPGRRPQRAEQIDRRSSGQRAGNARCRTEWPICSPAAGSCWSAVACVRVCAAEQKRS